MNSIILQAAISYFVHLWRWPQAADYRQGMRERPGRLNKCDHSPETGNISPHLLDGNPFHLHKVWGSSLHSWQPNTLLISLHKNLIPRRVSGFFQGRKQSSGWNSCVLTPRPGVTAELIQTGDRREQLHSGKRKEPDCRRAPFKSTAFKMEKNAFEKAFVTSGLSV